MTMRAAAALLGLAFACAPLRAQFAVAPIRLELGANARSGAIAVRNEGKEPITFQIQSMEWTQDAQGKDRYEETRDIVFFPKLLTVEAGQEGLVRVGTKTPVVPTEKTYRLFIEQLPAAQNEPKATQRAGAQVSVLIRFGAPIFVGPLAPQDSAQFTAMSLAGGTLTLGVKNTGNRHQLVQGIEIKGTDSLGKEVYALTLADRYLLAGTVKTYSAAIPAAQCSKIAGLTVELKTDKLGLKNRLDVTRAMCS